MNERYQARFQSSEWGDLVLSMWEVLAEHKGEDGFDGSKIELIDQQDMLTIKDDKLMIELQTQDEDGNDCGLIAFVDLKDLTCYFGNGYNRIGPIMSVKVLRGEIRTP
jgi:hypothetical protein